MDNFTQSNIGSAPTPDGKWSSTAADQRLSALSTLIADLDGAGHAEQAHDGSAEFAHQNQLVLVRLGMASSLFIALRAKHAPTAAHCLRVGIGCSSWALHRRLDPTQRDEVEVAALLHDIGKIGVPDSVLLKPGKLSSDEARHIELHRHVGRQILSGCCAAPAIQDIVHYAAAWYNGTREGFDRQGADLPLGSRMVAIVDAFDAMTTDQVYRRALSRERAIAELFAYSGTQFDPELVEDFCRLTSGDQMQLNADVARRWLRELHMEESNSFWRLGQPAGTEQESSAGSVFHFKLLESMHDAVVFVDTALRIVHWNRAAERMTGISASSVRDKRWTPGLIGMCDEGESEIPDTECPIAYAIESIVQTMRRLSVIGRDGRKISVDAQFVPVVERDGTLHGATMLMHDASPQISLEERVQSLHKKATCDPLTQVANRAEFDRLHKQFIVTHLEQGLPCSLIICDLDHFKNVNDTYGHQAGDEALVSFSGLLRRFCRAGDVVARYGGEEFVMLCADCDNATATRRAEELRRELAYIPQPMLGGKCITASFGVTEIQGGDTPETMLRRADRALLQAKANGRNLVVQLGSGIGGDESPSEGGWFAWLKGAAPDRVLERKLVTAVPLNVAVEKLRGFVADHHAEITLIEQDHVVIQVDGREAPLDRRTSDRPMPFCIELKFNKADPPAAARSDGRHTRTVFQVEIRPARRRDRRRADMRDRAAQLLVSLKSYLMAHELSAEKAEKDSDRDILP